MQRFSSCYLVVASLKFPFFWAIHVSSDPIHNIMISKSVFSWIFTNTFPLGGQFINFLTFQKWSAQLSGNISWFQLQLYLNYFHFWMVICYCWVLTIWPNIPDCFFRKNQIVPTFSRNSSSGNFKVSLDIIALFPYGMESQ